MSRRPGIGSNYLDTHTEWHVKGSRPYTQVNGVIGRLPRFYKDKLFTKRELELMALEGIAEADVAFDQEIRQFAAFHDDPYYYRDERLRHSHDVITNKCSTDTF